ncbi:MAG: tRNA (adenosine(37)-N6)-dimethylallyltransferase MiaA [Acidimicrobiales bacterium]|nr:tRNA (adenosine(37)-N6)-dimethylallyltransferase MiaA [Acidimicrobiales bacterium]
MSRERADLPLVILGATASGKSSLALSIAAILSDVELVSIDSMQVYRGMDIGTATPTAAEQAAVRHHLIDLVDASEDFAVGTFQDAARSAMADIRSRGCTPVLVGGTGLYLRAVIDDLELPGRFPEVAAELDAEPDTRALHERLLVLDPVAAGRMEPTNRRRVLRALEVTVGSGRAFSSYGPGLEQYEPAPFVQVSLRWPRETINERIEARYARQLDEGFLAEVEQLAALGPGRTAAQALGYRELLRHVAGECSLDEAIDQAILRTRRFARRQERWFRRDPRITWLDMPVDADAVIARWDTERGLRGA